MNKNVAAVKMYEFFKANRSLMPSNIGTQREFIIDSLCKGEEIASVFADAVQHADALALQTARPHKPK